jgi:guanidinoacetate N-methyltransferase
VQSVTFAAHFFPKAERLLRPGGRFSYLTNEADSLSRGHQRLLFQHFSSFSLSRVTDLPLPDDTRDAHWSAEMVIVKAIK